MPRTLAERTAAFPEPFSRVRGLRELSNGVVLLTDWIEEKVFAVDFGKGSATPIGRVGSGPREFRLPGRLVPLPGDSTLLNDVGNARLSVIGPDLAIHRSIPAQRPGAAYSMSPRGVDAAGRFYFEIPPWSQGPAAPKGDSVDIVRWNPRGNAIEGVGRVKGSDRPSWQREGKPRLTPGIPMVMFGSADGWAVLPEGRVLIVRSGDYRIDCLAGGASIGAGPPYAYPQLPVTDADKADAVATFLQDSPMSGRGPNGGLGHSPAASKEEVAAMVKTNEFATHHPYFRAGGVCRPRKASSGWSGRFSAARHRCSMCSTERAGWCAKCRCRWGGGWLGSGGALSTR
ncbi:MAG: hypothetical protein HOP28_12635 [Gemmatimonadales bacterium]|nr:hypothetical protein [Gemmatimonadales bacterium]